MSLEPLFVIRGDKYIEKMEICVIIQYSRWGNALDIVLLVKQMDMLLMIPLSKKENVASDPKIKEAWIVHT